MKTGVQTGSDPRACTRGGDEGRRVKLAKARARAWRPQQQREPEGELPHREQGSREQEYNCGTVYLSLPYTTTHKQRPGYNCRALGRNGAATQDLMILQ